MTGNVQAIKLLLDREWPAPNRHENKNDVPLVRLVDYTGQHESAERPLIPSTVEDEPTTRPQTVSPASPAPVSTWAIQRPEERETVCGVLRVGR